MKIVLDVDGVLADFVWGFTGIGCSLFGTPQYTTNEQSYWDDFKGLSKDQVTRIWQIIKGDRHFWDSLPPLVYTNEMQWLKVLEATNELYFVTSRVGILCKQQTETWLKQYGLLNPTVIVSSRKGEFASTVDADALLDDKAGNAVYAKYHSPKTEVYLLNRSYNRYDDTVLGTKVKRINSVSDFLFDIFKPIDNAIPL